MIKTIVKGTVVNVDLNIEKDLIVTIIGSFLGFGSALLTQKISGDKKDKEDKKRVRKSIIDELDNIRDDLRSCLDPEGAISIETPVWESVISTGMILYFIEHEKYFYDGILKAYNRISLQKKLENNYQNYKKDLIKEFREKTTECIDTCIGAIKCHVI